jgi:hypothetical protein
MRQDFPNRHRVGDEADQPDITTTVGTHQRKLLTQSCQQLRPGNPRRVVMARLCVNGSGRTAAAAPRGSQDTGMLARLRVPLLADIPDGKRRHGRPQGMVRCKHPVIPMPVPPGRRDQRCQPVKKLKRCQLDDTAGPGPRRLPRTSGPDPVPAVVPGQGVANPFRSVACAWHNRKPIERKRWPGTVTQQMFQALEVPRSLEPLS